MNAYEQILEFEAWVDNMLPRISDFQELMASVGWVGDFTRNSLVELEKYNLRRWPDIASFLEEHDVRFADGAARYIGETLLSACGGGWSVVHDPEFVYSGRPFVRLDTDDATAIIPSMLLTAMLSRRTGEVLSRVYDAQVKNVNNRRQREGEHWKPRREYVPGMMPHPGSESPELAAWVQGVGDRVGALRARVGYSDSSRLDLSLDSQPVAERLARNDIESGASDGTVGQTWHDQYVSYLGEVARRLAGGDWELRPGELTDSNPFIGNPYVARIDDDGDRITYIPDSSLFGLAKGASPGIFTKHVKVYADLWD